MSSVLAIVWTVTLKNLDVQKRLLVQYVTVGPVPRCLPYACKEDAYALVESTVQSSLPRNECCGQRLAPLVLSSPAIPAVLT